MIFLKTYHSASGDQRDDRSEQYRLLARLGWCQNALRGAVRSDGKPRRVQAAVRRLRSHRSVETEQSETMRMRTVRNREACFVHV